MEKISRILPTSHRFKTTENSKAQIARPGASELGRASIQEAQAAKISVSQLARDILKQAQDDKAEKMPQLLTSEAVPIPALTEPLAPAKIHEAPESAVDTLP